MKKRNARHRAEDNVNSSVPVSGTGAFCYLCDRMKSIRPHHLLCMHGFLGKGYSDAFADNMDRVIRTLREEGRMGIVFGSDDICAACPHLSPHGACETREKVDALDARTIALLGLEEREYSLTELGSSMKRLVTRGAFESICGDCSWFRLGICGETIQKRLAEY